MKRLPTKADLIDLCPHCLIIKQLTARLKAGGLLLTQETEQLEEKKLHKERAWSQIKYYVDQEGCTARRRHLFRSPRFFQDFDEWEEIQCLDDHRSHLQQGKRYLRVDLLGFHGRRQRGKPRFLFCPFCVDVLAWAIEN